MPLAWHAACSVSAVMATPGTIATDASAMLPRMTVGRYLLFACGQLGVMALARFFFQWVLRFTGGDPTRGVQPLFAVATVGLVFLGFRIFDGVTDPLAGALSDGWVRRGRPRRALLWWAFWMPALGLLMIFAPGHAMGPALRWLLLAGGMLVFFIGYTIYAIPYWSLIDDYSDGDLSVRRRLSNLLGAGTLLATALGFILSPILVEKLGFLPAALCFSAPCAAMMILPYWAAPRGSATAASDAPPASTEHADTAADAGSAHLAGVAAFREALRHRRFVAVVLLFAGGQMSFSVMTAAAPYIAVELLGGTLGDVAKLLGPFLLTAIPCFALVPRFSARLGWEKAVVVASLALGAVYAGTGGLGVSVVGSPMVTAMLLFTCAGPMAAVLLGVEGEAVAACADERPGQVTSIYFGVFNLVVKALNGVAMALTGALAELIPEQGTAAVRMMGFCAGGLLVVGVIVYALLRPRGRAAAAVAR